MEAPIAFACAALKSFEFWWFSRGVFLLDGVLLWLVAEGMFGMIGFTCLVQLSDEKQKMVSLGRGKGIIISSNTINTPLISSIKSINNN